MGRTGFYPEKNIQLNAFLLKHCDYRILDYFRNLKYKTEFSEENYPEYLMMNIWKYWIPLIQKSCCKNTGNYRPAYHNRETGFELRMMKRKSVEETARILNISEKRSEIIFPLL